MPPSQSPLPMLALVLLITGYAVVLADSYIRPSKVVTQCCKSVSGNRFPYAITGMKKQAALHPCVKAVIFYTNTTEPICSDPKENWVKKKVKELKGKAKKGKKLKTKRRRKPAKPGPKPAKKTA